MTSLLAVMIGSCEMRDGRTAGVDVDETGGMMPLLRRPVCGNAAMTSPPSGGTTAVLPAGEADAPLLRQKLAEVRIDAEATRLARVGDPAPPDSVSTPCRCRVAGVSSVSARRVIIFPEPRPPATSRPDSPEEVAALEDACARTGVSDGALRAAPIRCNDKGLHRAYLPLVAAAGMPPSHRLNRTSGID